MTKDQDQQATTRKRPGRSRNPKYYTDGKFDHQKWGELNAATRLAPTTCQCGAVVQKQYLKRHAKSKTHLRIVEAMNGRQIEE